MALLLGEQFQATAYDRQVSWESSDTSSSIASSASTTPPKDGLVHSPQSGLLARRGARLSSRHLQITVPSQKKLCSTTLSTASATSFTTDGMSPRTGSEPENSPNQEAPFQEMFEEEEVVLGRGSFSVVRAGRIRQSGEQVALKIYLTDDDDGICQAARREYDILRLLAHPNIVQCFGQFLSFERMVLVLERCQGRSLEEASKKKPGCRFPETTARHLFRALLGVLAYIHEKRVVHGDIKAANMIVSDDDESLKLIDFNTARLLPEDDNSPLTPFNGTALWAAPEALLGEEALSPANDVWSAGLCLHMMLTGSLPVDYYRVGTRQELAHRVTKHCIDFSAEVLRHGVSDPCRGFVETVSCRPSVRCLVHDVNVVFLPSTIAGRCEVEGVRAIFDKLSAEDKEFISYPDASHQLFMDSQPNVERGIKDI